MLVWIVLAAIVVARATSRAPHKSVILDHLEFGRRLAAGEDVHGPWRSGEGAPLRPLHAPYPPSFGLLTMPFAAIDAVFGLRAARMCWALVQIGALVALARWLAGAPTAPRGPPPHARHRWILLLTLVLASRFVLRDTHGGGGNLINVALCALAFAAAERGAAGRAGLWLGLSLATKPTMVWLLPVFALLGHRRAAGFAVGSGIGCVLLTLVLLRFDPGPWLRWLEGSWALATQADAYATPALGFPEFEWMNQSLRFAVARWLGTVPPEFAALVPHWPPTGLGLDVAVVAAVTRALSMGLLAWLLFAAWRSRANAHGRLLVFATALAVSLLLSPLTWKAHHTALLPLLYVLLRRVVERRAGAGTIAVLVLFTVGAAPGGLLLGDDRTEVVNSLYVVTALDVLLVAATLGLARREGR